MTSHIIQSLTRNAFGKLILTRTDGETFSGVTPVRAFPIQSPHTGVALVEGDGREVCWIEHLDELPPAIAGLIAEELDSREFMPEIQRILGVSSFATPSTWHVDTDRGMTHFVLKGDEDIRRIAGSAVLVTDNHGIQFLIRDLLTLDRQSRRILDRFM